MIEESGNRPQDTLESAGLAYFKAGLSILALHGKVPHPKYCPHGFKTPISSAEQWLDACVDPLVTGIGVVMGPRLWVLDIDAPIGWKSLYDKGIFPLDVPTAVTITARGAHFWFQSDVDVSSRGQGARFLPGVDLKASGYVVVPPSTHPDGPSYRWAEAPLVIGDFYYAADAPAALTEYLENLEHAEISLGPSPQLQLAQQDLTPLASHLRRASAGERNETLNWCALRAGATGHTLTRTIDVLLPVAIGIGLTPKESRATIRSGWKAGSESVT
jgi:hypothetical protein